MLENVFLKENVFNDLHDKILQLNLEAVIEGLDPICSLINTCQNSKSNFAESTQMWLSLHFSSIKFQIIL